MRALDNKLNDDLWVVVGEETGTPIDGIIDVGMDGCHCGDDGCLFLFACLLALPRPLLT